MALTSPHPSDGGPQAVDRPTGTNSTSTGHEGSASGRVVGAVLAVGTNVLAVLPRVRPIHPKGQVRHAVLRLTQPWPELGVPLLAEVDDVPVTVRRSRATGLPEPVPDISGLALRTPAGDLLFASTGTGRLTRRLLTGRRHVDQGPVTTLVPLHCRAGALDLRVDPSNDGEDFVLRGALDGGAWRELGRIDCGPAEGDDDTLRHDPVGSLPAGLSWSPFWVAARDPAYRLARRLTAHRSSTER